MLRSFVVEAVLSTLEDKRGDDRVLRSWNYFTIRRSLNYVEKDCFKWKETDTSIHKSEEQLIVFYPIAVNPCELPKSGLSLRGGAASTRDEGIEIVPALFAGHRFHHNRNIIKTGQRIDGLKKVSS